MQASLWVSALALAAVVGAAVREPSRSVVLDRKGAPYVEDNGSGRVLARTDAALRGGRDGEGANLELDIDCEHAGIDPVPGFAGVVGSNRRTARELDELIRTGALEVVTRDARGAMIAGRYHAARHGSIPER